MSISNIDLNKAKGLVSELEKLRLEHILWLKTFNKQIICKIHDNNFNVEHTACTFGQWYYSIKDKNLLENSDFKLLGINHQQLHKVSKNILDKHLNHKVISEKEYDNLIQTEINFLYLLDMIYCLLSSTIQSIDLLTKLPNRSLFTSLVSREHLKLTKGGEHDCIVFADIDHFKKINDTYGHIMGDVILKETAKILLSSLRKSDVVGRFGGEEFIVFLPKTDMIQAQEVIERARKSIESSYYKINEHKDKNINVTCSFGLTQFPMSQDLQTTIKKADEAMYMAKNKGRNRIEVFN